MNKKYIAFGLMAFFALTLVTAGVGYLVSSLYLTVGVSEPFTVQYAVLGDSGDYDPLVDGTCQDNTVWFDSSSSSIPTGDMFPEESRKLCVQVDNEGESPITYSISSKIKQGIGNYANCTLAFPEVTLFGTATGSSTTIDGQEFTVPGDAPVVSGCEVEIEVRRGVTIPVSP